MQKRVKFGFQLSLHTPGVYLHKDQTCFHTSVLFLKISGDPVSLLCKCNRASPVLKHSCTSKKQEQLWTTEVSLYQKKNIYSLSSGLSGYLYNIVN